MQRGTPFKAGNDAAKNKGPNKLTRTVKESVLATFIKMQSDPKLDLLSFAKLYPKEFYAIASKLIPTEVTATVDGTVIWREEKVYETK